MMTQNEIQRLHDLAKLQTWQLNDRMRVELSELAARAVQLLIAQSQRIRDLKAVNEAEKRSNALFNYDETIYRKYSKSKPPEPPPARTTNNAPDISKAFFDIFGIKP